MVKIQIELTKDEDEIVEIYKIVNNHKSKEEAIKRMISFFKVEIIPSNINIKDYFNKK